MLSSRVVTVVIFLLPLSINSFLCSEIESSDAEEQMVDIDEETFSDDFKNFIENGTRTAKLDKVIDYAKSDDFTKPPVKNDARIEIPTLRCVVCRGVLGYYLGRRRLGDSRNNLARSAIGTCRIATKFSPEVCEGLVNLNIDTILFIIDSRPKINQNSLCALLLQQECGKLDDSLDFKLNIAPKPTVASLPPPSSSNDMKVIHFTDIHFDPLYAVDGDAGCNDPLCCRKTASGNTSKAGYWGDYRKCDMPLRAVEEAFKHIAEQHSDADYIYYTGDFVPHNVWDTTKDDNIKLMESMYQLMKDTFGSKTIYPLLGNHEAHPVNVFAPSSITDEKFSNEWLYNYTALAWSRWLPQSTMETISKRGYYTILIKPGFRLIALNNNDCYIYNWWINYSIDDVVEQLQWLHDTLLAAEGNNERVHILTHIASGEGSCFRYWSREYRRVIERFSGIISAQFNGHSHYNEFNVFYDTNNVSNPISVAWNGGSITTFYDVNPNYNIYYVDGANFQVKDCEAWIFNLTEANLNAAMSPRWYRQYSFRQDFKIPDLSLSSLDKLLFTMTTDRSVARQYFQYKFKDGDPSLKAGCQDDCLRSHVCDISINEVGDDRRCKELLKNSFS